MEVSQPKYFSTNRCSLGPEHTHSPLPSEGDVVSVQSDLSVPVQEQTDGALTAVGGGATVRVVVDLTPTGNITFIFHQHTSLK